MNNLILNYLLDTFEYLLASGIILKYKKILSSHIEQFYSADKPDPNLNIG